jgi:hypothetical protein
MAIFVGFDLQKRCIFGGFDHSFRNVENVDLISNSWECMRIYQQDAIF